MGFDFIYGLTGAVIFLMVLIVVVAYIASKVFNISSLEAFAKVELFELFISVLILLFAQGLFMFTDSVSFALTGGDAFDTARTFHSRVMLQGVYPAIFYCYNMINFFSVLNTFQIRPNDLVWTWTYKIAPGADVFVSIFNLLVYGLIIVMATLDAHMFILAIIEGTMEHYFLPAGILLRFFPPTRKAGVFIITLSIAFYAVYPTMYALHAAILDEIASMEDCGFFSTSPFCGDTFKPFPTELSMFYTSTTVSTPFVIGSIVGGVSRLVDFLPGGSLIQTFAGFMASEAFIMTVQPELFSPVLAAIASLSLVTFFLPALSMVATIAFITGVSNFIEHKIGS